MRKIDPARKLKAIRKANEVMRNALRKCMICPRKCGVDRAKGETGYCRAGANAVVYSYSAHHGEEPPLSGKKGSGTIFFSYCNMKCVYCQNHYFSQLDNGEKVSVETLSKMMCYLEKAGCHNINLVSPTHFVPQIVMAMELAVAKGLSVPIVYNSGGYDSVDTLKRLSGIIDIYMPDMRYSDERSAKKYSGAADYVKRNREAVIEMQNQAGDLSMDADGIARRGLIIRLLALPENISGIAATLRFIKDFVSESAYLSIMSQYYPAFKACNYKELSRGVTREEYKNIVDAAKALGLNNGWAQGPPGESDSRFLGTNIKPNTEVKEN